MKNKYTLITTQLYRGLLSIQSRFLHGENRVKQVEKEFSEVVITNIKEMQLNDKLYEKIEELNIQIKTKDQEAIESSNLIKHLIGDEGLVELTERVLKLEDIIRTQNDCMGTQLNEIMKLTKKNNAHVSFIEDLQHDLELVREERNKLKEENYMYTKDDSNERNC